MIFFNWVHKGVHFFIQFRKSRTKTLQIKNWRSLKKYLNVFQMILLRKNKLRTVLNPPADWLRHTQTPLRNQGVLCHSRVLVVLKCAQCAQYIFYNEKV